MTNSGVIGHVYDSALLGFSATMPDVGVQALNKNSRVDYIEPDGEVTIQTQTLLGHN
ncbi:hypothetical protein DFQ27_005834 [Actinomortierella ambigua]|uniref:Inhibitor I9 domain-containing protein n=1 Tax=Actinomortierella ambigua TaxID=1343610 RepID=A0A9P6QH76_9FUNG|nr:hypothetical protein DFQ27_005834 [Actinomortierella ambigua]